MNIFGVGLPEIAVVSALALIIFGMESKLLMQVKRLLFRPVYIVQAQLQKLYNILLIQLR